MGKKGRLDENKTSKKIKKDGGLTNKILNLVHLYNSRQERRIKPWVETFTAFNLESYLKLSWVLELEHVTLLLQLHITNGWNYKKTKG